jgi:NAD(P)-dependent dehydrogenase (short-subunit alcohol dehydrogenase family)
MSELEESSRSLRVALVTGGARRIGRAISLALARARYDVVVHGRGSAADASELLTEIRGCGVRAAFVSADLARPNERDGLIGHAAAQLGPLTLLVNNASQYEDDAFGALDAAQWERQLAVNLTAPILLAQGFAAQAPAGADTSIVNITDQRVRKRVPRHFSYSLTKCALDAATFMMAQALAPRVRVNAVAPGPTAPSLRQDPAAFAAQQAALPLGDGPTPEDIAEAVVYLARARRITGETIAVDGGQHIAWQTPDAFGIDE